MKALLVSALIFTVFSGKAHAFRVTQESRCTTVDLRTELPIKMRDQGEISWCYAHAAADYLQFVNRLPVQVSAADIAVNYNQRRWPQFLRWITGMVVPQTGFIRSAIYDISAIGYCPEEYFPSEKWVKRFQTGERAGQTESVPLAKAVEEIIAMVKNVKEGFYLVPSDLPFVYEFKDMSYQQFYDAIFNHSTSNVLTELRSAACDSHRLPFPKNVTAINMSFKGKNTFNNINGILDEGKPLTVDFYYGFLDNIDEYERSFMELHTTLLMGRRFNAESQECQYLIKNSYGTDCSEYDKHHQCEAGYVWVGEASLFKAMTSYVYISGIEDAFSGIDPQIQDEPRTQSDSIAP